MPCTCDAEARRVLHSGEVRWGFELRDLLDSQPSDDVYSCAITNCNDATLDILARRLSDANLLTARPTIGVLKELLNRGMTDEAMDAVAQLSPSEDLAILLLRHKMEEEAAKILVQSPPSGWILSKLADFGMRDEAMEVVAKLPPSEHVLYVFLKFGMRDEAEEVLAKLAPSRGLLRVLVRFDMRDEVLARWRGIKIDEYLADYIGPEAYSAVPFYEYILYELLEKGRQDAASIHLGDNRLKMTKKWFKYCEFAFVANALDPTKHRFYYHRNGYIILSREKLFCDCKLIKNRGLWSGWQVYTSYPKGESSQHITVAEIASFMFHLE